MKKMFYNCTNQQIAEVVNSKFNFDGTKRFVNACKSSFAIAVILFLALGFNDLKAAGTNKVSAPPLTTASYSGSGTTFFITLNAASTALSVASAGTSYTFTLGTAGNTWSGGGAGTTASTTTLTLGAAGLTAYNKIVIVDAAAGAAVTFANSGVNAFSDSMSVVLSHTAGITTFNGTTSFTSGFGISVITDGNIAFSSASSLSTVNGNIYLSANMQATPNTFAYSGIKVTAATVQITGTGQLTMRARGGIGVGATYDNRGIAVVTGGVIKGGTTGTTTIEGYGYTGVDGTINGQGVFVYNVGGSATSIITSNGADVVVNGYGANSTAATYTDKMLNIGVVLGGPSTSGSTQGGTITSGGNGKVTVNGTGGHITNPTSAGSSGDTHSDGVYLCGSNTLISSGGAGLVTVNGTADGSDTLGYHNNGVEIFQGTISSGINGSVAVTGHGYANANQQFGFGLILQGATGKITTGTGTGTATVTGYGGNSWSGASSCEGVYITSSAIITAGGSGDVTVVGYGGGIPAAGKPAPGNTNRGVILTSLASITSNGGNVNVTGTGGGYNCNNNYGIGFGSGSFITAGGSGNVSVTGYGGDNTGTSGINNVGVSVGSGGSGQAEGYISSSSGNVTVTGTGGGGNASSSAASSSSGNYGVSVDPGGYITAGGTGTVRVTGTGGNTSPSGTGGNNYGVNVTVFSAKNGTTLYNNRITSSGGSVIVNGTGGGNGTGTGNYGVYNAGLISATGSGNLTVTGQGGNASGTGSSNFGVIVTGAPLVNTVNYPANFTSETGNVTITGTGGGSGTAANNYGVYANLGGVITAGSNGSVTVNGTGGSANGQQNYGVYVSLGTSPYLSTITSGGGNVTVIGTGPQATAGNNQHGVSINNALIKSGGNGNVTVTGNAGIGDVGTSSNGHIGVQVSSANAQITSGGNGTVTVTGNGGGNGARANNYGVQINSNGKITSGGSGLVTINGAGGAGTGNTNYGLMMSTGTLTSGGGNIIVNATEGGSSNSLAVSLASTSSITTATNGGDITIKGNSFSAATGNTVTAGAANVVNIKQLTNGTNFNIGTASTDVKGSMYISPTEFGLITGSKVNYGDANTGAITISSAVTGTSDVNLYGTGVSAISNGTDMTISSKTLSFGTATPLNIAINSSVAKTGYTQLRVSGSVDLTGTSLALSGSYVPTGGTAFNIVNVTSLTGTFTGLADGAITTFNGHSLKINYTATGVSLRDLSPYITTDPLDATVVASNTASFTVAGTAVSETPTIQWQVSTNSGGSWSNISGATNATYSFTATLGDNNKSYQAVLTNSYGSVTSTVAILTVQVTPAITAQPSNSSVIEGTTASFTSTASGIPAPTVQWQVNTGSGWSDVNGATNTTYSFTSNLSNSGNQYQAVFTNAAGTITSNAVTLTVTPACTPTSSNTPLTICTTDLPYSWNGLTFNSAGSQTAHFTNAGGCDSAATLDLTVNVCTLYATWTGSVSTDWNNAANWSNGIVPDVNTDVVIANISRKPTITGTVTVKNITIATGATLTNNGTINLSGDFSNNGTFTSGGSSMVILAGSGTLSGNTTFRNLEVRGNYTVGATSNDKIAVTAVLKLTSGTLSTSDKLTLVSNTSGTALIQENGGSLNGKAYIQHYTSGANGYHHFSSPVSGATVSTWSSSFPITGANNATAWVQSKVGTLQTYNEVANTTTLLDSGYYNYTSLSGSLTVGKGFTAWLNSLPTLNTFGTPNSGTITLPVTHTAGTNDPRGWNLVGNPYPSPISWSALKSLNPGLFGDASCYLWKSTGGKNGVWQEFNGTVGVNGAGDIINSSQGFFVYVNASGTLTFNNSVRNYTYLSPAIFGINTVSNHIRVSVNDAVSGESDEAVAYTNFNAASISRKMVQPIEASNPTIAFDVNGVKAAINSLKLFDEKTVLPLTITTPKTGNYTLKIAVENTSLPLYLKDAFNGTLTDVKASGEVFITTTATETSNRFSLVFKAPITDVTAAYNVFAKANNIVVTNPATTGATIVVYNTIGQQVARAMMTSTTTTIPVSSTSLHYVVKILDNKGANVVKQVVIK